MGRFNFQLLFLLLVAVLCRGQQAPVITDANESQFLQLPSNFPSDENSVCNTFDDTSYCEDVLINKNMVTVPLGARCICPKDWYCPRDPTETIFEEKCRFHTNKLYWVCRMRCVPNDSFKRYPRPETTAQP